MVNIEIGQFHRLYVAAGRAEQLTEQDVSAINKLMSDLTEGEAKALSRIDLLRMVNQSDFLMLVARDTDIAEWDRPNIVGTGSIHWKLTPTGIKAFIDDVVVDDNYQRKGIATRIIRELIHTAKTIKAVSIKLTSKPERVDANKLYLKLGFILMNEETNLYRMNL